MLDAAYKILKDFGFPVLVALGLGYFLDRAMTAAADERAVVVDQIADLRLRMEKCSK